MPRKRTCLWHYFYRILREKKGVTLSAFPAVFHFFPSTCCLELNLETGFWESIKGTPAPVFASDWTPCPLLQHLVGGRVSAPGVPVSSPTACHAPDTGSLHLSEPQWEREPEFRCGGSSFRIHAFWCRAFVCHKAHFRNTFCVGYIWCPIEYAKFTIGLQEFKSHSLQNTVTLF